MKVSTPGWTIRPLVLAAINHAVPHAVLPQLLRPMVAAAMSPSLLRIDSLDDLGSCATSVETYHYDFDLTAASHLLSKLPHLTKLSLCSTNISRADLVDIALVLRATTRLQSIDLSSCRDITDVSPLSLLSGSLTHVSLSHTGVTESTMDNVAGLLPGLSILHLRDCPKIDASALRHVAKLQHLVDLRVSACRSVDAAAVAELRNALSLQQLDLSETDISGDDLEPLSALPRLHTLFLRQCGNMAKTAHALVKLTSLQWLHLCNSGNIDHDTIGCLQGHPSLTALNVARTAVGAQSVRYFRTIPCLQILNVTFCRKLNAADHRELQSHVRHLILKPRWGIVDLTPN